MKLYIVRHGQRNFGKDFDTLQEVGINQAKKVGEYFDGMEFDKIYCSPQKRAQDTLKYIQLHLKNPNIETTEELKQQGVPEEVGSNVMKEKMIKHETNEQTRKRANRFLEYLLDNHNKDTILLVTHKRFTQFTVSNLFGSDAEEIKIPSGSITYLEFDDTNNIIKSDIGEVVYEYAK